MLESKIYRRGTEIFVETNAIEVIVNHTSDKKAKIHNEPTLHSIIILKPVVD